MRKRIWRMSEDKFDNKRPQIAFSEEVVTLVGIERQKLMGEFSMRCTGEHPMRGVVYTSNPYIRIIRPQFDGTEAVIRFEVLGQQYLEGDKLEGYFTILCNQQEYRLPFVVSFEKKHLMASTGEITSISDFSALAQGHWNEAMQLFFSPQFADFIASCDTSVQLAYAGYKKALPTEANFEEFLVAIGAKDPVDFTIRERIENFYRVSENRKETLVIAKNTWGYIQIDVSCDAPFITVEKDVITSDYFLGSSMLLNYYIHKNKMHAGQNRAKITFSSKGTKREIEIMATFDLEDEEKEVVSSPKKVCIASLQNTYKDFRFRKITTGDWCNKSIELLEELRQYKENSPWIQLMKAQCYIVNKQRQEALWIISDMKKEITDKSSAAWAYLLYLCTLLEPEESYVNRITQEIETIFREKSEDVRIFWFLLFLRQEYIADPAQKLKAIFQWLSAGHTSIFLYIEAYSVLEQESYLLQEFDKNSMQVMYWAAKHTRLSADLAEQIFSILDKEKEFDKKVFFLAKCAYEAKESQEAFSSITAYLLRTNTFNETSLPYFREAISLDLRLNGLYEAYMMSLPDDSTENLPQMLVMYFRYSCGLPYPKKALLYANIIANRKKDTNLYEQYLRSIETFAIEQMKLGHMNDNLAIIYQNVMEIGLVDSNMAELISGMIYMKKMVCLYPGIQRVFIYQEQYEIPVAVPVINYQAYVPILPGNYRLILERADGTLLSDTKAYSLQRLMYPERFLDRLRLLAPNALPFILADFDKKKCADDYSLEDIPRVKIFLESSLVSESYKRSKYKDIIAFFAKHCREEMLEYHFATRVDYDLLSRDTRRFVVQLFAQRQNMDRAYLMVREYDCLGVDDRVLLSICENQIKINEENQDEFLLALTGYLFSKKVFSTITLSYLVKYYIGPTADMICLWKEAKKEEIAALDLEENILFQALYAESLSPEVADIFDSYMTRGKDKMLMEAYINYWAHAYMLSSEGVPSHIFDYIAYYFKHGADLKESPKLAYMKYLSSRLHLEEYEYNVLDGLLQYYLSRNIYFKFYKNVDAKLMIKYHLYDKYFVEYCGNPKERVIISYQFDDKEVLTDEMSEMYDGIFVKQFVVFFGENIHYELYTPEISDSPVASDDLAISSDLQEGNLDRYDMLNAMQSAYIYGEDNQLAELMMQYQGLDVVTKELFTRV